MRCSLFNCSDSFSRLEPAHTIESHADVGSLIMSVHMDASGVALLDNRAQDFQMLSHQHMDDPVC